MIVTVFRSRLRPESLDEYQALAPRIEALARATPGYRSHKSFVAEDGERLTLVEFEDAEGQRGWAKQAEHVGAKRRGREAFYSEYSLQVCEVLQESRFSNPA